MEYLDFDLEVESGDGLNYRVLVRSPEGITREIMHFPFDELTLENHLLKLQNALLRSGGQYRATLTSEEQAVQDFGRSLFEALLVGNVRALYDACRTRAKKEEKQGVRLRLNILAPDLAALPWEFLYDPRRGEYLCLSRHTPLVRYPEVAQSMQPLKVKPPLRILAMIASPSDQRSLGVTQERERLHKAIADAEALGMIKLDWLAGQTWRDLQRAMRGGPWHIFHFIGHGGFHPQRQEGVLALANEVGTTHLLGARSLGDLLTNHDSLRLVILNACEGATSNQRDLFSSTAASLAKRGIPAVLAMQYEITDRAAIECSRTFYEALADGLPVDAAVAEARTAINIGLNNSLEWGTPVLFMRAQDGVLFDITERPTVPANPKIDPFLQNKVPPATQEQEQDFPSESSSPDIQLVITKQEQRSKKRKQFREKRCPFCFQSFHPGDCAVVSSIHRNPDGTYKILDPAPQGFWQRRLARLRVKPLEGPFYTNLAARRQCPHCHNLLPDQIESAEIYTIALVGSAHAGISTYLAALLETLKQQERKPRSDIQFVGLTQSSEAQYQQHYYTPLFVNHQALRSRPLNEISQPLIYELRRQGGTHKGPGQPLYLCLYDPVKGEDLADKEDYTAQYVRSIFHASAIIFLTDPLQMPAVANRLPSFLHESAPIPGIQASDVLRRIIDLYERYHQDEPISIPVAITLSKSDLLRTLVAPSQSQMSFLDQSSTFQELRWGEFRVIDKEVQALIREHDPFLLDLGSRFATKAFFAVSATGQRPDESGRFPSIQPLHCLDPLAWILWQLGVLRTEE